MTVKHFAVLPLLAALAIGMLLPGCGGDGDGDGDGGSTTEEASPASQLAPESAEGTVRTKVPVYAGDPAATQKPREESVLAELPPVPRPTQEDAAPRIRGFAGTTVAQWLNVVHNDVASLWQALFNSAGAEYPPVTQHIYSAPTPDCTGRTAQIERVAFYCYQPGQPVKGQEGIYLALPAFEQRIQGIGDAASAVVVAHEHGHRVQHVLRTIDSFPSIDIELQADCFAGLWMASKYVRGELDEGDIEEGLAIAGQSGDPPGTDPGGQGSHGTGEQRMDAFNAGYNNGEGSACTVEDLRARRPQ